MTHGTRACYQQTGCRCTPCRAANASYMAHLRHLKAHGRLPLGARISGKEAARVIHAMLIERYKRGQIARLLGLKRARLELHTDAITVRNHLKLQRLYRLRVLE